MVARPGWVVHRRGFQVADNIALPEKVPVVEIDSHRLPRLARMKLAAAAVAEGEEEVAPHKPKQVRRRKKMQSVSATG